MVRKVAIAILMLAVLIMCSSCFEQNFASGYGHPESDGAAGMRLSTMVAETNLEVGASLYYAPGRTEKTQNWTVNWCPFSVTHSEKEKEVDSWSYGVFTHYHIPVADGISPYVGAQANIGIGSDDIVDTIQPVGGVVLGNLLFAEYQHEALNGEDDKILFGLRIPF